MRNITDSLWRKLKDTNTLELAPGVEVVAFITKFSAENLELAEGKQADAVIKSSDVMVTVD